MTRAYSRFLVLVFAGSCLLPTVTTVASLLAGNQPLALLNPTLTLVVVALATYLFWTVLRRIEPALDSAGAAEAAFLDEMSPRALDVAIAGSAGLSLFLELAVIRWQASVFPFFAFYTNFGLLACFAGLGLGYALAGRSRIPLVLTIPLLGWQMLLLVGLKSGMDFWHLDFLGAIPITEQFSMGLRNARTLAQGFAIYFFLTVVFVLTALSFIPIGQVCGRLMRRRPHLRAYGLNLAGSVAGVLAMFAVSALWTPPAVWFGLATLAVLLLTVRRPGSLLTGAVGIVVATIALGWPARPPAQRVYSPYQLLELTYSETGHMLIRAAGHYYQRVHDLSVQHVGSDTALQRIRNYYDLPYRGLRLPKGADVAVVGAGAGNDVAAALRAGASRVDAIEIDPAILQAGVANHPEHPYQDPRVHAVVNDARSFLRTTPRRYDVIVYGLLDSHTLLSHASSVRLDSFVYTVEGFREARACLKPGGRIVLSFSILGTALGHKMYEMLRQAFDGADPLVVSAGYDGAVVFLQGAAARDTPPASDIAGSGFDVTTRYASADTPVDVSTDDWPFFYMPRRVYPVSYLVMLGLVLLSGVALTANFLGERPRASEASFFLLGAGFMLVETKAITELGLTFGSTWRVIGIVIGGILVMAFLANALVQRLNLRRAEPAFLLLFASLLAGWAIVGHGGLAATIPGKLATVVLLTSPMFFSGIVFSTLLRGRSAIGAVMSANLVGAMAGGLLEYNSMYFGFRFLYLLALGFYALAFAHVLLTRRSAAASGARARIDGMATPISSSAV